MNERDLRILASFVDDPEVRDLTTALLKSVLKAAVRDIEVGTQAARAHIIRTLLPVVAKNLGTTDDMEDMAEIRAELTELHRAIATEHPNE